MALRGPAAKAQKHGRSVNADWTEIEDVPFAGPSPELPKLASRRKWNEMVVQWWETVRTMPHCVLWTASDWQFAVETALIKDQFWRDYAEGDLKSTTATEIRRREGQMGTTGEALRQLRIRYVPAGETFEEEPEQDLVVQETAQGGSGVATVTPIADRRARLTRAG